MNELIEINRDDDCWTFTFNRPDKMNALNTEVVETLIEQIREAHDGGARLLVFMGNGKNFSAGLDQGELDRESDADLLMRLVRIETLLQLVASSPCLTVAFAQGPNFGAGVDLFAVCRRRFCTADATFRMPGLRFGLVLGTRRFGAVVGHARAREILEETRTIVAEEAVRIGLVAKAVDAQAKADLLADARRVARLLDRETQTHLYNVLGTEDDDRDLAELVRSASRPGLKARMLAYIGER
ncbi:enoyl-CoA hydratase/isomerase family protein [Trinickia mobilis]|uniref:enoyl-CoA hydratase/isomerase family protein n=1 Tax=Trinickia mobilis TaxID=2816356 RepID=UPI001A8F367A|nr:enoyl-CoA hydratase/isomerase family protein [Trinickia mobilis]